MSDVASPSSRQPLPQVAGHALPGLATPGQPRGRSWRALVLLALIFLGPPVLATLVYYHSSWRPSGHTNHGALIQPPRPLTGAVFHGKWSLVYLGSDDCDTTCRQALYTMRQTHWGLGELAPRLQRLFLVSGRCCEFPQLQAAYPGLVTLAASDGSGATLLQGFPTDARASTLFIVDPQGYLMMRYDLRTPPKGLLEDLKRLLQLSSMH